MARGTCVIDADQDAAGDDDDVRKMSGRCVAEVWSQSADHCMWSTGSPVKSSYH